MNLIMNLQKCKTSNVNKTKTNCMPTTRPMTECPYDEKMREELLRKWQPFPPPPSLPHSRCVFVCQCVRYNSPLLERIRKVKSEAAKCWIVGHWEINHLIKVGLDTKAQGQCWSVSSVAIWHCPFVMRTSNLRAVILTWMSFNDIHCHLAQRWHQRLQIDYQVIHMDLKNCKWVEKVVNKWERRGVRNVANFHNRSLTWSFQTGY